MPLHMVRLCSDECSLAREVTSFHCIIKVIAPESEGLMTHTRFYKNFLRKRFILDPQPQKRMTMIDLLTTQQHRQSYKHIVFTPLGVIY